MSTKNAANETARISDYQVLLKPVITEKASVLGGSGLLIFRVKRTASKDEIRGAIERIFNVKVSKVRTASYLGKVKGSRNSVGRRAAYKKAYVTLVEGQTVDIVEGL